MLVFSFTDKSVECQSRFL